MLLRGVVCAQGSVWCEPSTRLSDPRWVEAFPLLAGPLSPKTRFIPPWSSAPPESRSSSHRPAWFRPGSPSWVPTPFNGIHLRAPSWSRSFATHPGSALELSQLLSGLCKQAFHGLVSCRNRSWTAFPRAFPSQGSRAPLGVALPPCGYPPSCEARLTLTLSPPVSFDSLAPGAAPPTDLPKPADLADSTPFWGALAEFPRRL